MREIKVTKWNVLVNGEEKQESLLDALNFLISSKRPEDMPKGLDKFRLYGRLAKAFDEARDSDVLKLEDSDYSFLKKSIENDIPSIWGANPKIIDAVESFLNAK